MINENAMKINAETLKNIVRAIAKTQPVEIGCDECFEELDRFVEMKLEGKNVSEAMPLVEEHLERCGNCREEFEALLLALQSTS